MKQTMRSRAAGWVSTAVIAGLFFSFQISAQHNPAIAQAGHGEGHGAPATHHELGGAVQVHTVHMAGRSRTLTHHILMEFLLAAQGVDTADKLEDLRRVHAECEAILRGLRHGDEGLALSGTTNPEILDDIDLVELHWARFADKLLDSVDSGAVTAEQVADIDRLSGPLLSSMDAMVSAFEYFAYGGRTFSVLSQTVGVAQKQSSLTHKMARQVLLIAYGHEVERNQIRLAESFETFGRVLTGLVSGDPELRVLPAPTPALKEQYAVVERLWADFRPIIESTLKTGQPDGVALGGIAHRSMRLAAELDQAVELYHNL